jgi:hypothetical protein
MEDDRIEQLAELSGREYVEGVAEVIAAAVGSPARPAPTAAASPQGMVWLESKSPSGTTGDKLTTGVIKLRHDWLNVTAPLANRQQLQELVESYLGAGTPRDRGANTYGQSVAWESGALLAWSEGRPECWLSLNGDSCDLILPELKLELFHSLARLGCRCTRIDVAIDVPRELLSMELVHAAAAADQVVGYQRYEPRRAIRDMRTGQLDEDQARFGRRGRDGSGRFTRVYDKGLESDGEIDAVRVEVEYSAELAPQVFELMICGAETQVELEKNFGRLVTGGIDFADKTGAHGHRPRFRRLDWWERIVELVGTARVVVERVKPTLESSIEWLKKSTPLILARLVRAVDLAGMAGERVLTELVHQLLEKGQERLELFGGAQPGDLRLNVAGVLTFRQRGSG